MDLLNIDPRCNFLELQNVLDANLKTIRQMKAIYTLIILFLSFTMIKAQTDTVVVNVDDHVTVVIEEGELELEKDSTGKVTSIKVYSDSYKGDTTIIAVGSYDIIIQDDYVEVTRSRKGKKSDWHELTYWAGLDIGVNGYIMPDGSFDLPRGDDYDFLALNWGNSRTFSINAVEWKIKIFKNYIGITTGLGLEWNNYRLRYLDWKTAYNADSTYGVYDPNKGTNKSKLRMTYINAPFLLEFNTSKYRKNNFHIAMGVVIGWRIETMYKQRYHNEGGKQKDRTIGDFNMHPFRYNAMVRVGYGGLNLFATYALNPMFRTGTAPELHQVSVGITIVGW